MTVIRAPVPIFPGGAPEFAERYYDDVRHAVTQVLMERRESLSEIAKQIRELALDAAFVDVVVPAAAIHKENFHANTGFKELANLFETLSEPACWISGAVFRRILCRIGFAEKIDGFKRLRARAMQGVIHRLRVHGLKTTFHDLARP